MDILAGMAITSIVVTMVFYMSSTLSGQYTAYQNSRLELNDLLNASAGMSCQVSAAGKIREIPGGFELLNDVSTAAYKKADGKLTMYQANTSIDLYDQIEAVTLDGEPDPEDPIRSLVSGIHWQVTVLEQAVELHFYKSYSPADKINQLLLHEL